MTESAPPAAAESAPADPAASKATTKRRRRFPWVALLVLLLLAAIAGAAVVGWPRLAPLLGLAPAGPSPAALSREIATLREEMADTRLRLMQLEAKANKSAAALPGAADAGLEQRVAALEAALAARPAPSPHLADEVKAQGERLATVERNAADSATVLRLADRLDKVEAAARELQARRSSAGALLLAVGQLRQAVDAALPYDGELRALTVLAPDTAETRQDVAALRPRATTGIPGRAALAARFAALEPAILRAEILPDRDGWWRQTLDRLMSLVSVRREDGDAEGGSAAAVTARIQARLDENDLAQAVAEADHLSGGPAEAAAGWLDDARARLAADQALSQLSAQAVASSAAGQ